MEAILCHSVQNQKQIMNLLAIGGIGTIEVSTLISRVPPTLANILQRKLYENTTSN